MGRRDESADESILFTFLYDTCHYGLPCEFEQRGVERWWWGGGAAGGPHSLDEVHLDVHWLEIEGNVMLQGFNADITHIPSLGEPDKPRS